MTATPLGLSFGEFAIGSNIYDALSLSEPAPAGERIIQTPAYSTVFPREELGPKPFTVGGNVELLAEDVDDFILDVRFEGARRFSWHDGSEEVYVKVYSGDITASVWSDEPGTVPCYKIVSFAFEACESKKYAASDDSVIWGGGAAIPSLASLTPATGPAAGGTPVVVAGINFTGATAVYFGATASTVWTFVTDTYLVAVAPAHAAGAVNVTLTNATGVSTSVATFTYT